MATIAEKLEYLDETKTQIKNALISKGATIADDDTFRSYATTITNLKTVPTLQAKTATVTANGTVTYTPDSGYDGLSSVAITTNVPSSNLTTVFGQAGEWINGSKSYTIPATAKYAIIVVNWIKHHDAADPSVSLTVSKGTITNMDGSKLAWGDKDGWGSPGAYSSSSIIYKNYRKKFTNTTGQACTLKCNISGNGRLGGNILIVY